jgi:hypothetical protein
MAQAKKTPKKKAPRKKAPPKPPEPPKCEICKRPLPYQGERLCPVHAFLDLGAQYAAEQEKRGTIVGHVAAMLTRAGAGFVNNAYEQEMHKKAVFAARMAYAQRKAQAQQRAQQQAAPPPPPPQVDPFAVLGLDRDKATVESVRSRQRELARIFHTDAGGGPAANDRMAEVNAAADEAVRMIEGRG